MARRAAVRTRPGRTIDFKQWTLIPSITLTGGTAATNLGGGLEFAVPATVLRCRCRIGAYFDASMQAGDVMGIALGLGIVSSDAFDAGAASVPDPNVEAEYPWLWWGMTMLGSEITLGHEEYGQHSQVFEVDTKAMRKVKPRETLCWILQRTLAVGSPTTIVRIGVSRVLIGT